jgi:glycosyltransferase involved in cell wall biosynthesis
MMLLNKNILPVSVVLTTYNDANSIQIFLKNICEQCVSPEEILIVDGGSSDDTVNLVRRFNKKSNSNIIIINDGQRRNISEGLNEGIKRSKNEWVLIMGTGNDYEYNFIKKLWDAKKLSSNHIFYSNVLGQETTKFSRLFNLYFLNGNKEFDWGPSNHGVLLHKDIFRSHGLFWEGFHYAGEDTEFFNRLHDAKVECEYVKSAVLYWETPKNTAEFQKKMQVNTIAEWQIQSARKIILKICGFLIAMLLFLILLLSSAYSLVLVLFLVLIVSTKKKTLNITAITLGIMTKYILVWHYIRQRKFSHNRYSVSQSEIL